MTEDPLKILIVDNHPLFLESIGGLLTSPRFDVRKAEGGLEAIDIMDTFKPQIFFIDLIMPYINGDKLSRYIRAQEEFADSFIVILSGIASESEQIDIPSHADAFIAKGPLKLMAGHILDVIDQFSKKKRRSHPENCLGLNEISPRHITKELLFSVKHLEVLLANMREGILEVSGDNRIVYINPAAAEILGTGEFTMLSHNLYDAFTEEEAKFIRSLMDDFDSGKAVSDMVIPVNGHFVRTSIHRISDSSVEAKIIFLNDVTTFKEKEAGLKKALGEKEMLIREVHHRVKNNLNIISGLISLQSSMIADDTAREIMMEIQPRLQSISLVHDKLYKNEDLSNIDLSLYMEELASLLLGMMSGSDFSIDLEVRIPPLSLETDKTVSLGLICAELITNAVKYGFYRDNSEPNLLTISLEENGDGLKRLSVGNNGHPFPENIDIRKGNKLGFQVINLLVDQLNGKIELNRKERTVFTIIFE
ncbi:histidine kinase dimerization/phosphoacceptor domain -containing protein [Spirochaeta isovalerica]|uniref:histidine kinase n=1 Tax=Spirochaeta isovalerica TaxID=150 RepID=A0A841RF09_9SPIO|nr:histidine kinase dimerization/phosphoacceptor domain -containing protein [Spirochaeta isovalerica]MBB6480942.1 PAS domain S-box-containing protein [Spirochaeta isovalerica]